jgi:hypothetical protein
METYAEKCEAIRKLRPAHGKTAEGKSVLDDTLLLLAGKVACKAGKVMDPNPLFVWHGFEESDHKETLKYLQHRKLMDASGIAAGVLGSAAAAVTVVDLGAIGQGLNALGSTGKHLAAYAIMANAFKRSDTLSAWIGLIIKMKVLKATLRGGQLAVSVAGLCGTGAIAASLSMLAAKFGSQAKLKTVCNFVAMQLHWRAYQEQALLKGEDGAGPATKILEELFIRRGLTSNFGEHNYLKLIREPGGWMAIADKLLLI